MIEELLKFDLIFRVQFLYFFKEFCLFVHDVNKNFKGNRKEKVLGEGEVTFDALSESSAKGTFKFTGYNSDKVSVNVTEGSFNVNF